MRWGQRNIQPGPGSERGCGHQPEHSATRLLRPELPSPSLFHPWRQGALRVALKFKDSYMGWSTAVCNRSEVHAPSPPPAGDNSTIWQGGAQTTAGGCYLGCSSRYPVVSNALNWLSEAASSARHRPLQLRSARLSDSKGTCCQNLGTHQCNAQCTLLQRPGAESILCLCRSR